jgi:nucleotide-binding universal stress UspA family protein
MTGVWLRPTRWLRLAWAAALISIRLRIATALSETVVGTVAQLLIVRLRRHRSARHNGTLDLVPLRHRSGVSQLPSPPEPPTEVETQAVIELAARCDEELFDGQRRLAQERHVTLETYMFVGHPADQILKAAARYGAAMIVVGHRGRSAIRDWVSGSTRVGSSPVRRAPC